jgi:hypothetical protein
MISIASLIMGNLNKAHHGMVFVRLSAFASLPDPFGALEMSAEPERYTFSSTGRMV